MTSEELLLAYIMNNFDKGSLSRLDERHFHTKVNKEIYKFLLKLQAEHKKFNICSIQAYDIPQYVMSRIIELYNYVDLDMDEEDMVKKADFDSLVESVLRDHIKTQWQPCMQAINNTMQKDFYAGMQQFKDFYLKVRKDLLSSQKENFWDIFYTSHTTKKQYTNLGFSFLNKIHNYELITVAARTGMGKSTFALQCIINYLADNINPDHKKAMLFSFELAGDSIVNKTIANILNVSYQDLEDETLDDETFQKAMSLAKEIGMNDSLIINTISNNLDTIIDTIKEYAYELGLVVIDHSGLIDVVSNSSNKYEAVTAITGQLKQVALEYNIPIILVSQLNRGTESREDCLPQISDIRYSGSVEQDSDRIILLYRPYYYDKTQDPMELLADVAKNRHGESTVISCCVDFTTGRISD